MVYNYTKPRGPIAAMYNSPGPQYALPPLVGKKDRDPRSTKSTAPAYAFGIRHGKWSEDAGPGPAYYPDPKYLRGGKDQKPAYSIYSRPKEITQGVTPGPGAYAIDPAMKHCFRGDPAYSFGLRSDTRNADQTPGPNVYHVPGCVGKTVESDKHQAPAITITGRSKVGGFAEDLQKTPGPGAYKEVNPRLYKQREPGYSITGRNEMPGDTTLKPGPGAYKPETVHQDKKIAPKFSFGIRHSQYSGTLITQDDMAV
jgi:hypothetical protein